MVLGLLQDYVEGEGVSFPPLQETTGHQDRAAWLEINVKRKILNTAQHAKEN